MYVGGGLVDEVISDFVTLSVQSVLTVGTQIIDFIIDNPLLLMMFCGSLVGLGCYVISKVKGVARK